MFNADGEPSGIRTSASQTGFVGEGNGKRTGGQEEECGSDFEEVTTEQQGQETEAG